MPFGLHFPKNVYQGLFDVSSAEDLAFAETLQKAADRLDENLLPTSAVHPYGELIVTGDGGARQLLTKIDQPDEGCSILDALDALARIYLDAPAPAQVIDRLRRLVKEAGGDELRAAATQALAACRDQELLAGVVEHLASPDPGMVSQAARLIGLGRYWPALPVLRSLISPTRYLESEAVIWAVGEIGDPEALPELEQSLANDFRSELVLLAMGKIGSFSAIPSMMVKMSKGPPRQREVAYQALATLLFKSRERLDDLGVTRQSLQVTMRRDLKKEPSARCRYFMLLCLARLGEKMDRAKIYQALGVEST